MDMIEIIGCQTSQGEYTKLPLFTMSVAAGIPVPVDNDVDKEIDLNEFLVEHPAATFFAKVHGDLFVKSGICNDDVLVVDTAVEPSEGKFVIVMINNELSVKIYRVVDGDVYLESHDHKFLPIKIDPYIEFVLLGTVTKIIHSL